MPETESTQAADYDAVVAADAAMQEEARRFPFMGATECPGCHQVKYVGHGPLCHTCYMTRATPSRLDHHGGPAMSEMTPQHPAAPETETDANGKVELTYDERTTLAVAIHDLPANPCQCTHVYAAVERIVAERVRVVEGEREHWKDHAEEAGRGFERVCLDYNRVAAARTAATARAESAEAAHEAEKAAHERLRAGVEALASKVKREADDEWTAHSEAADMDDTDAANLHGAVAEVRDEQHSALRSLLGGGEAR